jgi:hypothetical protein
MEFCGEGLLFGGHKASICGEGLVFGGHKASIGTPASD